MKYLIVFIVSFLSLGFGFLDPDPPECINGIGHAIVKYDYSLRDTTGLDYSFDTVFIDESIIEWLIVPAGFDTLVFTCMRCDSVVKVATDTMRILSRFIEWDYEGVLTVGEMYTGETFYLYGYADYEDWDYLFGTLSPSYEYNTSYGANWVFWSNEENVIQVSGNVDYIYINGEIYDDVNSYLNDNTAFNLNLNPFPEVGDSCNVKIKLKE